MTKATPVRGKVRGVDGEPLAGASVLLIGGSTVVSLTAPGYAGFREGVKQQQLQSVETDADGKFSVNPVLDPQFLLAAHETGVGFVSAETVPTQS